MSTHQKKNESSATAVTKPDTAEAIKLLDQVNAVLGLAAQPLTAKQRKAATRSRKGMERVIPTLSALSDEHGVSVPKQPTSNMTSNLALAQELEAVQTKLTSLAAIIGANVDAARSGSWNTATTLYGMLKKVAHRDAQLASQLAPVTEFFAYRSATAKKAHPKRKGKKAAPAAEKEGAAKAAPESSDAAPPATPVTPSASPANGSTNGALPVALNGVTAHA